MICNKCKLEQEENNFETYWHSTFQKFYTRKICRSCMYKHNREYKLKVKEKKLLVTIEQKKCSQCNILQPVENFYLSGNKKSRVNRCKSCHNTRDQLSAWDNLDYRKNPNEYISDEQRDIVHSIMRKLNWNFNEEKGIWYKLPLKDENGKWNIVIKPVPKKQPPRPKKVIQLNVNEILEHRANGLTYNEIASIYNVSHTTIKVRVKQYKNNVIR